MRRLAFGSATILLQPSAWAHHLPLDPGLVCSSDAGGPGLALVLFVGMTAIGIVRAIARHRKDR